MSDRNGADPDILTDGTGFELAAAKLLCVLYRPTFLTSAHVRTAEL
ncbi:MAG: hypothetical protein AAF609_13120 [Cyanobacteria bacterium P01_C01_bin.120]